MKYTKLEKEIAKYYDIELPECINSVDSLDYVIVANIHNIINVFKNQYHTFDDVTYDAVQYHYNGEFNYVLSVEEIKLLQKLSLLQVKEKLMKKIEQLENKIKKKEKKKTRRKLLSISKVNERVRKHKISLYKKYGQGPHGQENRDRIDYVIDEVYKKQISTYNKGEEKVKARLKAKGLHPRSQQLIPIVSEGGKLEHLYIADFVVGKTIIESDGSYHSPEKDAIRDQQTSTLGYTTIRIPTSDLSDETIDSYLENLK